MPNLYSLCLISLIFLQAQFQMDDQKIKAKITFVTFKLIKNKLHKELVEVVGNFNSLER